MNRRNIPNRAFEATRVFTWFERDRAHVNLVDSETEQNTILEFWDEAVSEAIEDGFITPKDWHGSMLEYAIEMGFYIVPDEIEEYDEEEDSDLCDEEVAGAI